MESQNNFKQIEHQDSQAVISFNEIATYKISLFVNRINMFFTKLVLQNLAEQFKQENLSIPPDNRRCNWSDSVRAEILEPKSAKWKKGKIRMRVILEFCPDELEEVQDNNSLDDIRQTLS